MKILKLLNSNYLSILLIIFLFSFDTRAEDEPIDIWNIDQNKIEKAKSNNKQNNEKIDDEQIKKSSIYDLQSQREIDTVQQDSSPYSQEIKIIGLYDPEDYNLKIDLCIISVPHNLTIKYSKIWPASMSLSVAIN